eukprot:Opistho-2@32728
MRTSKAVGSQARRMRWQRTAFFTEMADTPSIRDRNDYVTPWELHFDFDVPIALSHKAALVISKAKAGGEDSEPAPIRRSARDVKVPLGIAEEERDGQTTRGRASATPAVKEALSVPYGRKRKRQPDSTAVTTETSHHAQASKRSRRTTDRTAKK